MYKAASNTRAAADRKVLNRGKKPTAGETFDKYFKDMDKTLTPSDYGKGDTTPTEAPEEAKTVKGDRGIGKRLTTSEAVTKYGTDLKTLQKAIDSKAVSPTNPSIAKRLKELQGGKDTTTTPKSKEAEQSMIDKFNASSAKESETTKKRVAEITKYQNENPTNAEEYNSKEFKSLSPEAQKAVKAEKASNTYESKRDARRDSKRDALDKKSNKGFPELESRVDKATKLRDSLSFNRDTSSVAEVKAYEKATKDLVDAQRNLSGAKNKAVKGNVRRGVTSVAMDVYDTGRGILKSIHKPKSTLDKAVDREVREYSENTAQGQTKESIRNLKNSPKSTDNGRDVMDDFNAEGMAGYRKKKADKITKATKAEELLDNPVDKVRDILATTKRDAVKRGALGLSGKSKAEAKAIVAEHSKKMGYEPKEATVNKLNSMVNSGATDTELRNYIKEEMFPDLNILDINELVKTLRKAK